MLFLSQKSVMIINYYSKVLWDNQEREVVQLKLKHSFCLHVFKLRIIYLLIKFTRMIFTWIQAYIGWSEGRMLACLCTPKTNSPSLHIMFMLDTHLQNNCNPFFFYSQINTNCNKFVFFWPYVLRGMLLRILPTLAFRPMLELFRPTLLKNSLWSSMNVWSY